MVASAVVRDWRELASPDRLPERPLASVLMLAYNQGHVLEEAVRSVLAQRVDFPYELIISDDGSTDATVDVARRLQREHPSIIRVLVGESNVGTQRNIKRVIESSRGEFLAFCEADDYWTSMDKLQRQVDLLRARPDVSLCFHAAQLLDDRTGTLTSTIPAGSTPTDYTLSQVIQGGGGMIPTASVVMRSTACPPMDDWFLECAAGDYPIAVWAAAVGTCHSLPDVMSVYRIGQPASWTTAQLRDPERDWNHVRSVIRMLQRLPMKAQRPDAEPAIRVMRRRLIRDYCADHGSNALRRMPGVELHLAALSLTDRLFLFACNDPQSVRMRATWLLMSMHRAVKRCW